MCLVMNARLVCTERILGGANLQAEVTEVTVATTRMVGLYMVDHVVALLGQVGAGQAAELLLPHLGEKLRQQ